MMEIVRYGVLYIGAVVVLAKVFDLTYLFQIKEYRFDRLFVFLEESGRLAYLYERSVKFPAKTARNFLIVVLALAGFTFLLFFIQTLPFLLLLVSVLLSPVISFLLVGVSVLITEVPTQIKRRLLIHQAKKFLQGKKVKGIGITGSYGKTTTKEYLFHILSTRYTVGKTDANMNTDVGVAISVLKNVTDKTDFFIAEVGAYTKGEIARACKVLRPQYAILTAISNQHLALFGSLDNLLAAKKELLEAIPSDGKIYLNAAIHEKSVLVRSIKTPVVLYAIRGKAGATLIKKGKTWVFSYKRKAYEFEIPEHVPYVADNLAPCIGLALDLRVPIEKIQEAVRKLPILPEKLSETTGIHNARLIRDTANSSVAGFLSALSVLKKSKKVKKIAVSKGIIELGKEKESSYKKILDELEKSKIALYTTDPLFKTLDTNETVAYFKDENLLAGDLMRKADSKTAILLEGRFSPKFIESFSL